MLQPLGDRPKRSALSSLLLAPLLLLLPPSLLLSSFSVTFLLLFVDVFVVLDTRLLVDAFVFGTSFITFTGVVLTETGAQRGQHSPADKLGWIVPAEHLTCAHLTSAHRSYMEQYTFVPNIEQITY
jgi:hypothetical protein